MLNYIFTYTLKSRYKRNILVATKMFASYIQGQSPEPKVREYFYYIDHQGMLFLDDTKMKNFTSCFKDKQFLEFFFKRLRLNNTERYKEFPFISICGRERNFVRCDDLPIVFTHVIPKNIDNKPTDHLSYGHAGELLTVPFEPSKLYMDVENGRVYHPVLEKYGGIGLVRSKLAIEFSKLFKFMNGEEKPPTEFHWKGIEYNLSNEWYLNKRKHLKMYNNNFI